MGFVLGVPVGGLGVQIPTVVVERLVHVFDRKKVHFLEALKTNDDVCYLHTGIVDVVLYFHLGATSAKNSREGISQGGIPQVPDVRGLVRIDVRMLYDDLVSVRIGCRLAQPDVDVFEEAGAFQIGVDIASAGSLKPLNPRWAFNMIDNFLGDLPGWSAQNLGELEGEGKGQIAKLDAGGNSEMIGPRSTPKRWSTKLCK